MQNAPEPETHLLCHNCRWPLIKDGELKCFRSKHPVQATLGQKHIFCPFCRKPKILLAKNDQAICPKCGKGTSMVKEESMLDFTNKQGMKEIACALCPTVVTLYTDTPTRGPCGETLRGLGPYIQSWRRESHKPFWEGKLYKLMINDNRIQIEAHSPAVASRTDFSPYSCGNPVLPEIGWKIGNFVFVCKNCNEVFGEDQDKFTDMIRREYFNHLNEVFTNCIGDALRLDPTLLGRLYPTSGTKKSRRALKEKVVKAVDEICGELSHYLCDNNRPVHQGLQDLKKVCDSID